MIVYSYSIYNIFMAKIWGGNVYKHNNPYHFHSHQEAHQLLLQRQKQVYVSTNINESLSYNFVVQHIMCLRHNTSLMSSVYTNAQCTDIVGVLALAHKVWMTYSILQ